MFKETVHHDFSKCSSFSCSLNDSAERSHVKHCIASATGHTNVHIVHLTCVDIDMKVQKAGDPEPETQACDGVIRTMLRVVSEDVSVPGVKSQ
jgi:hypothetical protein